MYGTLKDQVHNDETWNVNLQTYNDATVWKIGNQERSIPTARPTTLYAQQRTKRRLLVSVWAVGAYSDQRDFIKKLLPSF